MLTNLLYKSRILGLTKWNLCRREFLHIFHSSVTSGPTENSSGSEYWMEHLSHQRKLENHIIIFMWLLSIIFYINSWIVRKWKWHVRWITVKLRKFVGRKRPIPSHLLFRSTPYLRPTSNRRGSRFLIYYLF